MAKQYHVRSASLLSYVGVREEREHDSVVSDPNQTKNNFDPCGGPLISVGDIMYQYDRSVHNDLSQYSDNPSPVHDRERA